jgi:GTP-binding protein
VNFRIVTHFPEAVIPPGSPMFSLPQVAIFGRSNAGKSSLLNALLDWKHAARVSNTPGRTREIHYFLLENSLLLADLPGYGYAAVSRTMRKTWDRTMLHYLDSVRSLRLALLVADCRRDPTPDEDWLLSWAGQRGVEMLWLANKVDQLRKAEVKPRLASLAGMLRAMGHRARVMGVSAREGAGVDDVLERVRKLLPDESRNPGDPPTA